MASGLQIISRAAAVLLGFSLCFYPCAEAWSLPVASAELIRLERPAPAGQTLFLDWESLGLGSEPLPEPERMLDAALPESRFTGSPELAGWLNTLFPGAGYWYIDEPEKALLAAPLVLPLLAPNYIQADTYELKAFKTQMLSTANLFNDVLSYDTYQTALDKQGRPFRLLQTPHYSFAELYLAPFSPHAWWSEHWQSNLFRFGTLGLLLLASVLGIAYYGIHPNVSTARSALVLPALPLMALAVGVGEEVYFRGLVQPTGTELTQSLWTGNLIQSSYFALAHTSLFPALYLSQQPYGLSALAQWTSPVNPQLEYPYVNSAFSVNQIGSGAAGGLGDDLANLGRNFAYAWMLGWLLELDANDDALLKNIAWHTLYDFIAFSTSYLVSGDLGRLGLMKSYTF